MCILGATVWAEALAKVHTQLMCILGSTRWAKSVAKVPSDPAITKFDANTNKCNLFVSDVIYESGAK